MNVYSGYPDSDSVIYNANTAAITAAKRPPTDTTFPTAAFEVDDEEVELVAVAAIFKISSCLDVTVHREEWGGLTGRGSFRGCGGLAGNT